MYVYQDILKYKSIFYGCSADYTQSNNTGIDQLANLIKGLKEDPFSRRHLLTTYCPLYTDQGVLAPCHGIVVQFYCESHKDDGMLLSCHVYLRSSDTFLGQPYNIASYAMLTYIIAKMIHAKPERLVISMGDCHIYNTHDFACKLQLTRTPLPFPVFTVSDEVSNKTFDSLSIDDFDVIGYLSHPPIKAPMAI